MSSLTSVETVKEWLGIQTDGDDLLLARLIGGVSAWVEQYIGRAIASAAYDEYYTCSGDSEIPLMHYPVTAVSKVTVDGVVLTKSTGYGVPGWALNNASIVLSGGGCFSSAGNTYYNNARVEYTAGYTAIPADLEQAVVHLVSLRYRERDRIGQRSKILAGETVFFSVFDLPPDVKSILDAYKEVAL